MMSANQLFLVVLAVTGVGSLALKAACIKWGLKWSGIAKVSIFKAFGLLFVFFLSTLLAGIVVLVILWATSINPSDRTMELFAYAGQFVVAFVVVALIYRAGLSESAIAITPLGLASIATLLLVYVIRSHAYGTFWIPTNAMAPTLLGFHWEAPCPRCGHPAYGTPLNPLASIPPEGVMMVCSNERQPVFVSDLPNEIDDGDRILTCKFIAPHRSDMIVFRYPQDATINYVKRLVGFPGETLATRDGAVWINGKKLDPPESLTGIHYSPTIEANGQVYSSPGSEPVELGPDEYYVLGDFVQQSVDSRLWERGAPGYPPYAVPESNIIGVVINIYWPINRWRSFR